MTHTLNTNIATASNGQILEIEMAGDDIALSIHAEDLDQPIQIDLMWSNDRIGAIPLLNTDGDPQSIALTSGATSVAGAIFAFVKAKYLHLMLNKLTATAGSIVKVETNY